MITAAFLICLMPTAYDGDTLRCGDDPTRVRLAFIQAPEIVPLEPGAVEARAAAAAYATGGAMCEPPGASYNRIVGICRNYKGQDIGKLLLDGGYVKEWCAYSVSKTYPKGYYGTCP